MFALAAIAALGLRDFERGAPGSRAVAMGVVAFAVLFYYDFKNFPEKGLSAFGVGEARFPDSFKEDATRYIKYGTVLAGAAFFLSFMEAQSERHALRSIAKSTCAWPRASAQRVERQPVVCRAGERSRADRVSRSHLAQRSALPLEAVRDHGVRWHGTSRPGASSRCRWLSWRRRSRCWCATWFARPTLLISVLRGRCAAGSSARCRNFYAIPPSRAVGAAARAHRFRDHAEPRLLPGASRANFAERGVRLLSKALARRARSSG